MHMHILHVDLQGKPVGPVWTRGERNPRLCELHPVVKRSYKKGFTQSLSDNLPGLSPRHGDCFHLFVTQMNKGQPSAINGKPQQRSKFIRSKIKQEGNGPIDLRRKKGQLPIHAV